MKKTIMILVVTMMSLPVLSQGKVALGVWQDAKLGLVGDNIGNPAGTIDLLVKLKMEGNQVGVGFITVSPMFEYADLEKPYYRYAADVAYTYNNFGLDNLQATASVNYGIIHHGGSFQVFGADFELSYSLTDRLGVSLLTQIVDRKDLAYRYGNKGTHGFIGDFKASGFIGLTYNIFGKCGRTN